MKTNHCERPVPNGALMLFLVFSLLMAAGFPATAYAATNFIWPVEAPTQYSSTGEVSGNVLDGTTTLTASDVVAAVTSTSGSSISGGTLTVKNSNLLTVMGGHVRTASSVGVTGCSVTVEGGIVYHNVVGGARVCNTFIDHETADVSGNSVSMTGVGFEPITLDRLYSYPPNVYGGYSSSGNVFDNTVSVTDSTVYEVYGGYNNGNDAAGNTVSDNAVSLVGSTAFQVTGGYGTGLATSNQVYISGSTVSDAVDGGYSLAGNATGNTVTLVGGTFAGTATGGYSEGGDATGNTISIDGATPRATRSPSTAAPSPRPPQTAPTARTTNTTMRTPRSPSPAAIRKAAVPRATRSTSPATSLLTEPAFSAASWRTPRPGASRRATS